MDKYGDYMFVCEKVVGEESLKVFDVSDPSDITLVTRIYTPSDGSRSVKVRDGIAYITHYSKFVIVNVTNIYEPVILGSTDLGGGAIRMILKDDYAIIGETNPDQWRIVSFKNKSDPVTIFQKAEAADAIGLYLGGPQKNILFLGTYQHLIFVYDITDIEHPDLLWTVGGSLYGVFLTIMSLHVKKNNLYVASSRGLNIFEYGSISLSGTVPISNEICGNYNISVLARTNMGYSINTSFTIQVLPGVEKAGNIVDDECTILVCDSVFSNDSSERVCNGHGNCTYSPDNANGLCVCDKGWNSFTYCGSCMSSYSGVDCDIELCFGILFNDSSVCSGNGNCSEGSVCECEDGYEFSECEMYYCNGTSWNNSLEVCNGHGNCTEPETCDCESPHYSGDFCERFSCFGVMNNESDAVCSNHGECINHDHCVCVSSDYLDFDCGYFTCFQFGNNDTVNSDRSLRVCSDHGVCTDHDECECEDPNKYHSEDCGDWKCDVFWNNQSRDVCSSHGNCKDHDSCDCLDLYTGDDCEYWSCYSIPTQNVDYVCGGHGNCVAFDVCGCQSGYFPSSGVFGDSCDMWKCGSFQKNHKQVCNQRGNCTEADTCECFSELGYTGDDCESWSCGGIDHSIAQLVCNGNGKCIGPNKCKCKGQYIGDDCNTNLLYFTVMTPILTGFAMMIGICLVLFVTSCIFCIVCCACCSIVVLFAVLFSQREKMKRFRKLKDFELLLKEQEADQDSSIAHIRVQSGLFEIDFDSLKVERILGEGGSESIVYKANWSGQIVAFKCFKTRMICSNQDKFDEFEKEVSIFSSISHPNVVRFYGCTMKPPRVGIVMEFCENGELLDFLLAFNDRTSTKYPIESKIRMIHEVAIGMQYLHSRNIIHRDLKCENVLIDRNETCKLMDFGLSKIAERMSQVRTKRVGTSFYMAPEVVKSLVYSEKCDVFSFGILCFIVITEDNNPYGEEVDYGIEFKVASDPNFRPDIENIKKYLRENGGDRCFWICAIIMRAWTHRHETRPSFKDLNEMFQDINRDKLMVGKEQQEEQESEDKQKNDDDDNKSFEDLVCELKEKDKKISSMERELEMTKKELEFYKLKHEIREDNENRGGKESSSSSSFLTKNGENIVVDSTTTEGGKEESESDGIESTDSEDEDLSDF